MVNSVLVGRGVSLLLRLCVLVMSIQQTACQFGFCDYQCQDQDQTCYTESERCNGVIRCNDEQASDERDCLPQTVCGFQQEKCPTTAAGTNNACIYPTWRCDGDDDCGDMSDEDPEYCRITPCPSNLIRCTASNRCIPGHLKCDGKPDCPDGSDEPADCWTDGFMCPTNHFECLDKARCVPNVWLCDGENDCRDGSDESEELHTCSAYMCSSEYFTCQERRPTSDRCIPLELICDGTSHCEHAEDEDDLMCGTPLQCQFYEFKCTNNLCIPSWYTCDHDNDCGDGSDEGVGCTYPVCNSMTQFTCRNGRCITKAQECNGYDNCRDNSDEETCSCPTGQFKCRNKQCIQEAQVCDGNMDCDDNSDETSSCFVNECTSPNFPDCTDQCVDTRISYYCLCPDGYKLDTDEHTCIDVNECNETPWVCSQICNNLLGSYSCECSWGYEFVDNSNCRVTQGGEPYIIFSNRYYIRRRGVDVNTADYERIASHLDLVVAMDFHYEAGHIYFSDVLNGSILRIDMNGENLKVIHDERVDDAEGLAVDWVTRKLYWIDRLRNVMEVSELDGRNRLVLIRSGLFEPRAVAVDPKNGYVYWTDWGLRAYIGRVGMDGTDKIELHDETVAWPNGLTIDYGASKLYWADAHLDYIAYSDMNFENIHRLLHDDEEHTIGHPFAITVFNNDVYFTDWNLKGIYKADKHRGNEVLLQETVHRPFDIHIVHPLRQDSSLTNVCAGNPCHGLCLIAAGGATYTCTCAENYKLESDRCVPDCPSNQFSCNAEHKCIPWYRRCDGVNDCSDSSDEIGCLPRNCLPGQYECSDSSCLPSTLFLCDGMMDCPDSSDEGRAALCNVNECESWQFPCRDSSRCVQLYLVCNQQPDCDDGSDEDSALCETHTCSEGYFQCDNDFCIPLEWKCDLDNDCGDDSDEPHSECQQKPCPVGWIPCRTNYRCIPEYARCNGYDECRDNSDEVGCEELTCDPKGEFRCDNHRCIPQRWYCDFEDDCMDQSDEVVGCEPRPCSETEFRCVTRGRCIRDRLTCNGEPDCSDGSDEASTLCNNRDICSEGEFKCVIGGCIFLNQTCNNVQNCNDNSDELNCQTRVCKDDEFSCLNTICVALDLVCDSIDDCGDGSDETIIACRSQECASSTFKCPSGQCLAPYQRCDGTKDCLNGSDESGCVTTTTPCNAERFFCNDGLCVDWSVVCNNIGDCADLSDEEFCHNDMSDCSQSSCQKECIPLVNSPRYICSCGQGYAESADGNCEDINECYLFKPCSQICRNIKGSYQCFCAEGFQKTRQGCKVIGERETLLVGDGTTIRKYQLNGNQFRPLVTKEIKIESIDFHFGREEVYFTDSQLRAIKRVPFNNNETYHAPDNLGLDNVYRPMGIAVDWMGNNIYFTDQGLEEEEADGSPRSKRVAVDRRPKVAVASLTSHPFHEKTLHTGIKPYAIAVNPTKGLMYWTDIGGSALDSLLFMSWMNGDNMMPVVAAAGKLSQPTGLAVDYSGNDTVYWCDSRADTIGYITYDGSLFNIITSSQPLNRPFQLDVFGSSIYWTTLSSSGKVQTMNKSGDQHDVLLGGLTLPTGIKVWQKQRYPQVDNSSRFPCSGNPCMYLCLIVPQGKGISKGFECACPTGVDVDLNSCSEPIVPTPTKCFCDGNPCDTDGSCRPPKTDNSVQIGVISGASTMFFIAIVLIIVLILLFLRRRRRSKFNGQVTYRDGQNVDITPPAPAAIGDPTNHYETRLPVQDPVTFENPAYTVGAAGGGVVLPEKSGLPYDPSMYQPGYQAGPLPQKVYLPDGTLLDPNMQHGGYPEAPPAYSSGSPPPVPPTYNPNKAGQQE